uniref:C2 domain-containing protein n=1 Tax=Oryza punctata TaxID=4537 RepID=A0A0E0L1R1_ORYPU
MAMACRTLELSLLSASDLRGVNLVSKMEVYAVVYLAGDPRARQRVATDRAGGRNPSWKDKDATVGSSKTTHGVLNLSYKLGGVVHPDPAAAAACSCKPAAPAAGGSTMAYLAAAAAAYRAGPPPPLYGYRQLPPIPQPVPPTGAAAGAGVRAGR